ncbi:MAG: hypothetical protein AAF907_12255 [Planctomycetota bacterium]
MKVHHLSNELPLHTVAEMVRGQRTAGIDATIGLEPLSVPTACGADVVHLHWPEETLGWKREFDADSVAEALRLVDRAAGTAAVVMTVHNLVPHRATIGGEALYRAFLERADGYVHLGERSVELTEAAFPGTRAKPHAVVPHPNYDGLKSLPGPTGPLGAPRRPGEKIVMSFGAIRSDSEERFLREVRRRIKTSNVRAVIHVRTPMVRFRDLKRPFYNLRRRLISVGCGRIEYREGFVPDGHVLATFEQADAVLLGRNGQLNSAVVPLAFSCSRRIAGPDETVIGELLRAGDNAVYSPGDADAAAAAVDELLARPADCPANRALADDWAIENGGAAHRAFYERLLAARSADPRA